MFSHFPSGNLDAAVLLPVKARVAELEVQLHAAQAQVKGLFALHSSLSNLPTWIRHLKRSLEQNASPDPATTHGYCPNLWHFEEL